MNLDLYSYTHTYIYNIYTIDYLKITIQWNCCIWRWECVGAFINLMQAMCWHLYMFGSDGPVYIWNDKSLKGIPDQTCEWDGNTAEHIVEPDMMKKGLWVHLLLDYGFYIRRMRQGSCQRTLCIFMPRMCPESITNNCCL